MTTDTYDKGVGSAEHFTSAEGWTPGNLDFFVIPQKEFDATENDTWKKLYQRQMEILPGRAVDDYLDALKDLGISQDGVPRLEDVNRLLQAKTGWQVVTVPGLIPDAAFFELLANKRFPVGNFIRRPDQLDYIQEPDIFHDVFGHVPLLANQVYADHIEAFGKGGLKAAKLGATEKISRLYWYTIEFGLINTPKGLRIFGAGIMSSPKESVFALESPSPHRIAFDVERVLQTRNHIDDFQDIYFVIDSFQDLFDKTDPDFTPIYARLATAEEYNPDRVLPTDKVIHKGTGVYANEAAKRREARRQKK